MDVFVYVTGLYTWNGFFWHNLCAWHGPNSALKITFRMNAHLLHKELLCIRLSSERILLCIWFMFRFSWSPFLFVVYLLNASLPDRNIIRNIWALCQFYVFIYTNTDAYKDIRIVLKVCYKSTVHKVRCVYIKMESLV